MPTHEKGLPNDLTDTRASDDSEMVGLYRGFSNEKSAESKAVLNQATFSVWAATLILCSVLVFGLYQIRGRLQAIQAALEQSEQDKKLLLEGMDELLVRTGRPSLEAKAEPPHPKPPEEPRQDALDENKSNNLAKKYKIYYRTKAGEDLTRISKKFGVSEEQIRLWNTLEPSDSLIPGQVLVINKSTEAEKAIEKPQTAPL